MAEQSITKKAFYKRKKFWIRFILLLLLIPALLFSTVVVIVYAKQDEIVKELITKANEDFEGAIRIKDSHVSPFANFPYISIDLEDLEIFEGKDTKLKNRLLHLGDVYVGFNLMSLINGNYKIKSIKLKNGKIRLVQHVDGSFNIANALKSKKPVKKVEEELHLDLQSIK
ncbi:MAG: AsmA family protein, partial [Crocinitomicaceae bacterium]|nr:AsmA family protein [Crocinitomicaceae bacterium]